MIDIKTKLATAGVTGVLFLSAITPAFAANTDVFGNGAFSNNDVSVSSNHTTSVEQSNVADISNNISTNSSTGNNRSDFNTGGSSFIRTGDASSVVGISNEANANHANISGGNTGSKGNSDITVAGNGAFSDTNVRSDMNHRTDVSQDNTARFDNTINSRNQTGNNSSGYNTGEDSQSEIMSGNTDANVYVHNAANTNMLGNGMGSKTMHMNWSRSSNGWMSYWYSM